MDESSTRGANALALASRLKLTRELVEMGPAGFGERFSEGRWWRARHIDLLSRKLAAAAAGRGKRVIVSEPPRHGKSEFCSHWFPAWFLSLFPGKRVILASYEADFAATWGRKVRNTLTACAEHVPVRLAADSTAANRWDTTAGGGMTTAGVGGPITGKGAHLLLIDDPVKNAEEADSPVFREKVWEWWTSTAYTRLEPGASAVVVMTRWHEDDLVGRLLADAAAGGEEWEVVNLPAVCEAPDELGRKPGDPLWEDRYNREGLAKIRRSVGERVWTALYQQRPAPEAGAMFQRGWFRFWRYAYEAESTDPAIRARTVVLPRRWNEVVDSWDLALKETAGSDLVAGAKIGCHGAERYLLDLTWERLDFPKTLTAIRALATREPRAAARLVEDAANGPAALSMLRKELSGILAVKPEGSKRSRAAATTPVFEAGQFFIPLHAEWRDRLIEEFVSFPVAPHDDAVDAVCQALNYTRHRDYLPPDPEEPARDPIEAELEQAVLDQVQAEQEAAQQW